MKHLSNRFFELSDRFKEISLVLSLWSRRFSRPSPTPTAPIIVSMTSYPGRIRTTWLAIETLIRQTVRAERIVLVLNDEEFPERKIPKSLTHQQKHGLEIMWVDHNGRSYDKLLPVRKRFPGKTIVTCDDDKYFPRNLIELLVRASESHPEAIIGSRGWRVRLSSTGHVHYGENWIRATRGESGRNVLTPGGNGCLYPFDSLHPSVDNFSEALQICPTADDIWFWASAMKRETDFVCLGMPPHRPIRGAQRGGSLASKNIEANDSQFQDAIDHFGIRTLVLDALKGEARP